MDVSLGEPIQADNPTSGNTSLDYELELSDGEDFSEFYFNDSAQDLKRHRPSANDDIKPSSDDEDEDEEIEKSSITNESDLVAKFYSSRRDVGIVERKKSPIFYLKLANNWVKSVLVNMFCARSVREYPGLASCGFSILDLCGGKGGDLKKFFSYDRKVRLYVLADIADGSVRDAVSRFNSMNIATSTPRVLFASGNLGEVRLHNTLDPRVVFDLVSCQFAFHYCFADEGMARMMLQNAADRLRPGGYFFATIPDSRILVERLRQAGSPSFGNSVYKITFDDTRPRSEEELQSGEIDVDAEARYWNNVSFPPSKPFGIRYEFFLLDAVEDVPEYLVHFETLCQLASEFGLRPVLRESFHNFFGDRIESLAQLNPSSTEDADIRLLRNMKVFPQKSPFPQDQWDALGVYCVIGFQKIPYAELGLTVPSQLVRKPANIHSWTQESSVDEVLDQLKVEAVAMLEHGVLHVADPTLAPIVNDRNPNQEPSGRWPRLFATDRKAGELQQAQMEYYRSATLEDDFVQLYPHLNDGDVWET